VAREEDDEKGDRDDDYDDSPQRRRRLARGRRRSEAQTAVIGPAIGLMVTAALNWVICNIDLAGRIFNFSTGAEFVGGKAKGAEAAGQAVGAALGGVWDLIGGWVFAFLIVLGAIKMYRLQAFSLAMTSAVLAVIPCTSPCCLLGIPIGIWALVILNQDHVKRAFD
jgi:hypothetical protein